MSGVGIYGQALEPGAPEGLDAPQRYLDPVFPTVTVTEGLGSTLLASAEWDVAAEGLDWALLRTATEVGLVPFYETRGYTLRRVRQMTYAEAPTYLDGVMTKRLAVIGDPRPEPHG